MDDNNFNLKPNLHKLTDKTLQYNVQLYLSRNKFDILPARPQVAPGSFLLLLVPTVISYSIIVFIMHASYSIIVFIMHARRNEDLFSAVQHG